MYKLSVIVLLEKTNRNKFKTLNSLKNQTLKDIEINCISNLLEEDEKELIKFASEHPNINIKKDINETISKITGEYTVIANSNVFFETTWAQKVYDYAKIDNEDIIVTDLDIEDYQSNKIKSYTFEKIENEQNKIVLLNWNLCNILFKTEKIKKIRLKKNNKYNELLFILEVLTDCEKIGYAQDVRCYLHTRKSYFNNIELKDIEELKDILKEIKEIYKEKNKYNEANRNILSAIAFIKLGVEALIKVKDKNELNIDIKKLIKEIINYLDVNFFEWRNNEILKSQFMKKENSNIWYAHKMYRYGYIELYLKLYRFLNK